LGLSGYAVDDLLLQDVIIDRFMDALEAGLLGEVALLPLVLVGLSLRWREDCSLAPRSFTMSEFWEL